MWRKFLVRRHISAMLMVGIWGVAATMMHPTGASLLALGFITVGLFTLRAVAHVEGSTPK